MERSWVDREKERVGEGPRKATLEVENTQQEPWGHFGKSKTREAAAHHAPILAADRAVAFQP